MSTHSARRAVKAGVQRALGRAGYALHRLDKDTPRPSLPDIDDASRALIERVSPYTLTGPERIYALRSSLQYLDSAGVAGDVVECGVWRGGSLLAAALTLLDTDGPTRDLYGFDTFDHVPPPTSEDATLQGQTGQEFYEGPLLPHTNPAYGYLPIDEVNRLITGAGWAEERLHLVQGLVEDTIPEHAPEQIALLRLDTDWYQSTRHELEQLMPRLVDGGVLIIDDYGEFLGARKAVDEYIESSGLDILLHRVDYTGRVGVVHR